MMIVRQIVIESILASKWREWVLPDGVRHIVVYLNHQSDEDLFQMCLDLNSMIWVTGKELHE